MPVHRYEYFNVISDLARITDPPKVPAWNLVFGRFRGVPVEYEIRAIKPEMRGIDVFGSNELLGNL